MLREDVMAKVKDVLQTELLDWADMTFEEWFPESCKNNGITVWDAGSIYTWMSKQTVGDVLTQEQLEDHMIGSYISLSENLLDAVLEYDPGFLMALNDAEHIFRVEEFDGAIAALSEPPG